jgi:hypothetical protein
MCSCGVVADCCLVPEWAQERGIPLGVELPATDLRTLRLDRLPRLRLRSLPQRLLHDHRPILQALQRQPGVHPGCDLGVRALLLWYGALSLEGTQRGVEIQLR